MMYPDTRHSHIINLKFRHQHWINFFLCITILLPNELIAFHPTSHLKNHVTTAAGRLDRRIVLPTLLMLSSVDSDMEIVSAMKISEIKAELQQRKISISDVFEKDELIRRLLSARQNDQSNKQPPNTVTTNKTTMKTNTDSNHNVGNDNVLATPLYFTTMDSGMRVPANNNINGGAVGIIVEPSTKPYATMKIQIPSSSTSSAPYHTLSLLVDTACTGFVLRPNIVQQYQLPSYDTPVTMQGAAGISQATGLTQLSSFTLVPPIDSNIRDPPPSEFTAARTTFRSLPAAVQDIHGLPVVLDGIIGLTFINQFAAMEFDFRAGLIYFYKDRTAIPDRTNRNNNMAAVVVDTKLNMIGSLGIYTVPVYIGGRGPVQMLVDTGASCTLLNWKGVADLGLSQSSKQISRIAIPTGAMGSENVAIQLTHRLHVSSTFQLGDTKLSGIPIRPETRMPIDIGQIPVIDNIPGVGGILGIDALMRCRILQISTRNPATLTLFV